MLPTPRRSSLDAGRTAVRLEKDQQRERTARRAAGRLSVPGAIGVRPALLEQAKGALMLHLGVDSHEAFEVLFGWARAANAPVAVIAHTLLRGVCKDDAQTDLGQRALVGWLETQLRDTAADRARIRTARAGPDDERAHQIPRRQKRG